MRLNIFYPFVESAHGGGNQFLKALKHKFIQYNVYEENISNCDAIIFNAHQNFHEVIQLKSSFPSKIFVHRMDGLYKLYNRPDDERQDISIYMSNNISNGTIFQTNWAKEQYKNFGFNSENPHAVILNAPNSEIFQQTKNKRKSKKINLVCTSWSINKNKGFEYYEYLDKKLDFNKYSFTYIGNDPGIEFKNIKKIPALDSIELAIELSKYDIFLTASKHECCSNSLLEALSCGLPSIGLNSGGTPEIIREGGELFNSFEDLIFTIDKVSSSLKLYSSRIEVRTIDAIAKDYLKFINTF